MGSDDFTYKKYVDWNLLWVDKQSYWSLLQLKGTNKESAVHIEIYYLTHLLWMWALIKILYVKKLMLDKEDNIMSYVCLFANRSNMVVHPSACVACFHPILAKNSRTKWDTTCASKNH